MLKGIDVSKYQRFAEDYYETLNQQQLSFVFIKASEGIYKDPSFAHHSVMFSKTCLLKGAYHFFRFKTAAKDQADFFVQTIRSVGNDVLDLPPVVDIEDVGEIVDVETAIASVKQWLTIVEGELGVRPIIYTGGWYWRDPNHMNDTMAFKDYALWTSRYSKTYLPMYGGWAKPTFWQYTDKGRLPGYNGDVDLDYFFDDIGKLWSMTKNKKVIITPDAEVAKIYPIQIALMHMGLYSGKIDGKFGSISLKAFNTWCATKNLPAVTDAVTPTHWGALFNLDPSAPAQPVTTPIVAVPGKKDGVVTSRLLNIRKEPGTDQPMVAMPLPQNKQVHILDEKDGWYKVSVDIEGWVSKSFIK